MNNKLILTLHAKYKLQALEKHGFHFSFSVIEKALEQPDRVEQGYGGRWIAQKGISPHHVIRVVYEKKNQKYYIVTIYPGRRERYEKK